ncbi:hypothetical protein PIROE2DRAFT_2178 [Piromyces sp. E2]|nr:hypothetical protein PIROE2DRAFT_2178 [Piromyces sp. E2]|eukprot:OUM69758.1 hypothetical protein PIROE2DRAFT_2178 [Piromyces sp. E2]
MKKHLILNNPNLKRMLLKKNSQKTSHIKQSKSQENALEEKFVKLKESGKIEKICSASANNKCLQPDCKVVFYKINYKIYQ